MTEEKKQTRRGNANPPHWPTNNLFQEGVAGVAYYFSNIEQITLWNEQSEHSFFACAQLIPNPNNEHDKDAVEIWVEGRHIGHLSSDSAQLYKTTITESEKIKNPPVTTANIRVDKINSSAGVRFDAYLDMSFKLPPIEKSKIAGRTRRSALLPKLWSHGYIQDGHFVLISPDSDLYTVEKCYPGAQLDIWSPEGSEDIYLYAPGSVGGGGRVALTDESSLRKIGFKNPNDFAPFVHTVAGNLIITCAKLPEV